MNAQLTNDYFEMNYSITAHFINHTSLFMPQSCSFTHYLVWSPRFSINLKGSR